MLLASRVPGGLLQSLLMSRALNCCRATWWKSNRALWRGTLALAPSLRVIGLTPNQRCLAAGSTLHTIVPLCQLWTQPVEAYCATLRELLVPNGRLVIVAVEFDTEAACDAAHNGLGPHSLSEQELRNLFPAFIVTVLEEEWVQTTGMYRRLQAPGLHTVLQRVYLLQQDPEQAFLLSS